MSIVNVQRKSAKDAETRNTANDGGLRTGLTKAWFSTNATRNARVTHGTYSYMHRSSAEFNVTRTEIAF